MSRKTLSISSENFERFCKFGSFGERQEVVFERILTLAEERKSQIETKAVIIPPEVET